jgi:hypothetical protein
VYTESAFNKDVSQWMREDELANTLLTRYGEQRSAAQRLSAFRECYKSSPAVMTCWADYCKTTPVLAQQNLTDALAYVLLQEPNIREAMTKAHIGMRSPLAAVALQNHWDSPDAGAATAQEVGAIANAAAAPGLYTQAQLEQAVAEAVAQAMTAKNEKYCWLHGYQATHAGPDCTVIKDGAHIRAKRDSRAGLATTMVFGRSGGITSEQAKAATKPSALSRHPGNAIRPGDRSHP